MFSTPTPWPARARACTGSTTAATADGQGHQQGHGSFKRLRPALPLDNLLIYIPPLFFYVLLTVGNVGSKNFILSCAGGSSHFRLYCSATLTGRRRPGGLQAGSEWRSVFGRQTPPIFAVQPASGMSLPAGYSLKDFFTSSTRTLRPTATGSAVAGAPISMISFFPSLAFSVVFSTAFTSSQFFTRRNRFSANPSRLVTWFSLQGDWAVPAHQAEMRFSGGPRANINPGFSKKTGAFFR